MLSNLTKNCQVFFENALNISRLGDILLLGSMDSYRASYVSELISSVISAKGNENLPSLRNSFALKKEITPQWTIVSLCLAGRFSVVLRAGSWQDLHYRVWGSVRLFLCLDVAPCARMILFPRGRHASVRLSPQSSNSSSRRFVHPAGLGIFPRQIPESTKRFPASFFRSLSRETADTFPTTPVVDPGPHVALRYGFMFPHN